MSRSALYFHFRSKEDMLFEILADGLTDLQTKLSEVLASMTDEPPDRRLESAIIHTTKSNIVRQSEWQTVRSEFRSLQGAQRQAIIAMRDRFERVFRDLVREGIDAGLWPELDVKLFVFNLFAIMNCFWYRPDGPKTIDEIAQFNAWYALRVLGHEQMTEGEKTAAIVPPKDRPSHAYGSGS